MKNLTYLLFIFFIFSFNPSVSAITLEVLENEFQKGNYAQVYEGCRLLINQNYKNIKLHKLFIDSAEKLNKLYSIEKLYYTMFQNDPENFVVNYCIGYFKIKQGADNYNEALRFLNKSIQIDHNSEYPYKSIAFIYFKQGNYDKAKNMIEGAVKINPKDYDNHIFFAYLLSTTGFIDNAAKQYVIAADINYEQIKQKWRDTEGFLIRDMPFVFQEDFGCGAAAIDMVCNYFGEKEINKNDTILKCNSTSEGPYLVDVYDVIKSHTNYDVFLGAEKDIDQLCNLIKNNIPVILVVKIENNILHSIVVVGINEIKNEIIYHDPAYGPYLTKKINIFEKEWTAAGFQKLIILPKNLSSIISEGKKRLYNINYLYYLGQRYFAKNEFEDALSIFRSALKQEPNDLKLRLSLAATYGMLHQYSESIKEFLYVSKYTNDDVSLYYAIGATYGAMEKPAEAIKYYLMAVDLDPKFKDLYFQLAINYYENKQYWKSLISINRYIKNNPSDKDAIQLQKDMFFDLFNKYKGVLILTGITIIFLITGLIIRRRRVLISQ